MKVISVRLLQNIFVAGFILLFTQCATGQKGSGNVIKEVRNVSSFNEIEIGGSFEVFIRQSSGDEEVSVVSDDNLMENIIVEVKKQVLQISIDSYLKKYTELKVYITVKDINRLEVSGACELEMKNTLKTDDLRIEISGASESELDLDVRNLAVDISGASETKIKGSANSASFKISGASELEAFPLNIQNAEIEASGASSAKINVSEKLIAKASGASDIKYQGNPSVDAKESGAASISKD